MQLQELKIPSKKVEILEKKGITSVESLLYSEPKKYLFFSQNYALELTPKLQKLIEDKVPVSITGICTQVDSKYKNGRSLIKIRMKETISGKTLFINIIGEYRKYDYYQSFIDKEVIVGGVLQYSTEYKTFSMLNPIVFSGNISKYQRIIPIYHKYKGISEEYYENIVCTAEKEKGDLDYIPDWLLKKYKMPTYKETIRMLHHPSDAAEIEKARQRIVLDHMIYFTCKLEEQSKLNTDSTKYIIKSTKCMEDMISSLPFKLTEGQNKAIYDMTQQAMKGHRISSLIQGDVGSGKTIVALSLMAAMAENGYQSVLMAPTAVLATQHYHELKERTEKYGFKAVLLTNELKASEKKKILVQIKNGECNFIVGTHSCISASVEYCDLGLIITDEEHKFGVLQREALVEKAGSGVHNIIMSGTPIPRTLANTLYGNCTEVYSMELPQNRKPIQTAICKSDKPVFNWMLKEIAKGRQCYVVCPLIETAEEGSKMEGVSSIDETAKKYSDFFSPRNITVSVITGKTSKEEQRKILDDFKTNKSQILMATTVIEVGVNNPNATVMVITGAERFGLATLHQLRGRVGRGEYQSYCILQKSENSKDSTNLEILCQETDGLEIAKADLQHRGTGNILGNEQSGHNKYIDLMLMYPHMYEKVKMIAKELCKNNTGKDIIKIYEEYYQKNNL